MKIPKEPTKAKAKQSKVALSPVRIEIMMQCVDGMEPSEAVCSICLVLSLVYRGIIENTDSVMNPEQFTDQIGNQVRGLIAKPPPGFEDTAPTPGCPCEACSEKRERLANAH